MPRNQHQQRVGEALAHQPMRGDECVFFFRVRAARHPHRPVHTEQSAQLMAARLDVRRNAKIELDVADDVRTGGIRTDRHESFRVFVTLRGDEDPVRESLAKQPDQPPITVH